MSMKEVKLDQKSHFVSNNFQKKMFYFQHSNHIPDAIATSKGLGGGLPLGAFIVNKELSEVFNIGDHLELSMQWTLGSGNPYTAPTSISEVILDDIINDKNQDELINKIDD